MIHLAQKILKASFEPRLETVYRKNASSLRDARDMKSFNCQMFV